MLPVRGIVPLKYNGGSASRMQLCTSGIITKTIRVSKKSCDEFICRVKVFSLESHIQNNNLELEKL